MQIKQFITYLLTYLLTTTTTTTTTTATATATATATTRRFPLSYPPMTLEVRISQYPSRNSVCVLCGVIVNSVLKSRFSIAPRRASLGIKGENKQKEASETTTATAL